MNEYLFLKDAHCACGTSTSLKPRVRMKNPQNSKIKRRFILPSKINGFMLFVMTPFSLPAEGLPYNARL